MNYDEAVTKAAKALKTGEDANWLLARLTAENTSNRTGRPPKTVTTATVSIAQWALDVRAASGRAFGTTTAKLYRQIWVEHGATHLAGSITWPDAYEATRGASADERMGDFNLKRGLDNATPAAKREAFVSLAKDAEVVADRPTVSEVIAEAVTADPEAFRTARPRMRPALREVEIADRRAIIHNDEQVTENDPVLKSLDEFAAFIDLSKALSAFRKSLAEIWPRLSSSPRPKDDLFVRASLDTVKEDLAAIENYLNTGTTDLDRFISAVLDTKE